MNITGKMLDDAQCTYDMFTVSGVCDRNAMSKAIEAAIQAAWVKFDVNDRSTWPPILPECYLLHIAPEGEDTLVLEGSCGILDGELVYGSCGKSYPFDNKISHWMPTPKYKK
jgi:hypothetical protein